MITIASDTDYEAKLDAVREYWENHVHDWKVARSPMGTLGFFEEIEAYRFEKLHYLPRRINFGGYAGQRVLDVGCGVGNDLNRFAQGGADVTGIDLAPHSIDLAEKNFAQRGLAGEFEVMNGEAMRFDDDIFDVVYCHTALHFTPNPSAMVREMHRVLKPGGQAIIMTVNRYSWLNFLYYVSKINIDHLDSPIFYQYTPGQFRRLLQPFDHVRLVLERFPVPTKVHKGLKARLYNNLFVGLYNGLPQRWTARSGHHLLAFASKSG